MKLIFPREDITGRKYGRYTVLKFVEWDANSMPKWLCECECGSVNVVYGHAMKQGKTLSCGCLHAEQKLTHGLKKHPLYMVWRGMNERCFNVNNKNYKYYGKRGITVCNEWKSARYGGKPNNGALSVFIKWSELQAEEQGISIDDFYNKKSGMRRFYELDRVHNNDSYEPENCKWVSHSEQMSNRRPYNRTKKLRWKEKK